LNQQSVRSDLRADDLTETSKPEEQRQHVRRDVREEEMKSENRPEAKEGTKTLSETWKEGTDKSDEKKKNKVTKC
jgi:hypothetical protein